MKSKATQKIRKSEKPSIARKFKMQTRLDKNAVWARMSTHIRIPPNQGQRPLVKTFTLFYSLRAAAIFWPVIRQKGGGGGNFDQLHN